MNATIDLFDLVSLRQPLYSRPSFNNSLTSSDPRFVPSRTAAPRHVFWTGFQHVCIYDVKIFAWRKEQLSINIHMLHIIHETYFAIKQYLYLVLSIFSYASRTYMSFGSLTSQKIYVFCIHMAVSLPRFINFFICLKDIHVLRKFDYIAHHKIYIFVAYIWPISSHNKRLPG